MEMMDVRQADWIDRWGSAYEATTRLRKAFATAHGRKLLKWVQDQNIEADVLAFVLIFLVWPVQAVKARKGPKPQMQTDGVEKCWQTAQWLRTHGATYLLPDFDQTAAQLQRYAIILQPEQVFSGGGFSIGFRPGFVQSRNRRDVAKRHVIAFLTGYFKSLADDKYSRYAEHPPWDPITDFLVVAELIPPDTKPKRVATVWSNTLQRAKQPADWDEQKFGPCELEQWQAGMLAVFHMKKDSLDGKDTARDYSSTFQQILTRLRKYS